MVQADSVEPQLLAALQAETKVFQEFKATLQTEQVALVSGDVSSLTMLAQSKQAQVELLNRLATERLNRIAALGFPADRSGMETWAKIAGSAALEAWHSMLAIAGEAHQANKINGNLIQTRLQHNQQALAVLLSAGNGLHLYGPDGQPKNTLPVGGSPPRGTVIGKA